MYLTRRMQNADIVIVGLNFTKPKFQRYLAQKLPTHSFPCRVKHAFLLLLILLHQHFRICTVESYIVYSFG